VYHFLVARKTRSMFEKPNQGNASVFIGGVRDGVVFTYLDTQKKAAKLQSLAEHGFEQADPPPLTEPDLTPAAT
jgi:hypothetical protein